MANFEYYLDESAKNLTGDDFTGKLLEDSLLNSKLGSATGRNARNESNDIFGGKFFNSEFPLGPALLAMVGTVALCRSKALAAGLESLIERRSDFLSKMSCKLENEAAGKLLREDLHGLEQKKLDEAAGDLAKSGKPPKPGPYDPSPDPHPQKPYPAPDKPYPAPDKPYPAPDKPYPAPDNPYPTDGSIK